MKRMIAATLATCMFALAIAAATPVAADEPEELTGVLLSHMTISFASFDVGKWVGMVNGPIHGTVVITELPATFDGDYEYFHESFVITTSKGTISGEDWGAYNLVTAEFWAHGIVQSATDRWEGLVGYTLLEWGVTTPIVTLPIVATNVPVVLVPPEPIPAHAHDIVVTNNDMVFSMAVGHWEGTISGDMEGTGAIYLDSAIMQPENKPVKEYFFESSVFETRQGTIQGNDRGVFDLTTGNFWGVGQITDASGRWHFMEGYAYVTFGNVPNVGQDPMNAVAPFIFLDV